MVRRASRLPKGRWAVASAVVPILMLALARPACGQEQIGLALGTTPPAVTLQDLDGNPVDLARYIGRQPLLVEFWATWCPLCRQLLPRLDAADRQYGAGVQLIVVAVGVNENPRSIRRHIAQHPMAGMVLWDGEGKAVRAFDAPGTSYVVALDRAGRVVYTGYGADQDIAAALRKAKR
jgi:thiol-disulfide isomerase/thioredoxin